MGLFGKKDNENNVNTSTTPVDQHIIDEVNNSPKADGAGGGSVERMTKNSDELQMLLDEFKAMQDENGHINTQDEVAHEYHDDIQEGHHEVEEGEKYTLSAEENDQIEKYLMGEDDEEPEEEYKPIEDIVEEVEEEVEEVIDDDDVIYIDESEPIIYGEDEIEETEEVVEDELIEDEEVIEDESEEIIEDEVEEIIEDESEEIIEDEVDEVIEDENEEIIEDEATEIIEDEEDEIIEDSTYDDTEVIEDDEIIEDEPYVEDEGVEDSVVSATPTETITESDIDKKLDEKLSVFEEQLLAKLMATMNMSNSRPTESVINVAPVAVDADSVEELEDLKFEGQVVIFEPIEKIKQATWEDVVRRKGHYTYHVTGANNGGWFIKRAKSANPYAYVERKEEAMKLAIAYAKREKAELKVHDAKGVIEASMSFGREKKMN